MPKAAQQPIRYWYILYKAVLYSVIAWTLGFALYYSNLPKPPQTPLKADAIVVLTGGPGRIEAGIMLLEHKAAPRMLISGVHPSVLAHELPQTTGTDPKWFTCCIELGYTADNTHGNAHEARDWATKNNYTSLLIVTESHHMPRSLAMFQRAMPTLKLIAYPVENEISPFRMAKEYSKYLITLLQDMTGL